MAQLKDITEFLDNYLVISKIHDDSLNGLQVEGKEEINGIALGVDACAELFEKAESIGANFIIAHHGIFWKEKDSRAVGIMGMRLKYLLKQGISLYAAHLPIDMHKDVGNNAQIAALIGLKKTKPFAKHAGENFVGLTGELETEMHIDAVLSKIESCIGPILRKDLFGKKNIKRIAVVSGSGAQYAEEAAKEGADLFLTGEAKHSAANDAKELKMNAVFAGHYKTETFGMIALGKILENRFKGLKSEFIYCSTEL